VTTDDEILGGRRFAPVHERRAGVQEVHFVSIVDDDPSMRMALVRLIRSLGHQARGFASAEEFLQSGAAETASCLITDIQMPGMSGIELQRQLSATQTGLPVIMITARPDQGLEDQARANGAFCFLRKPFEADALIGCLDRALNQPS
jgi:FixJ family two-component response regulator